jgi:hypothetical protein
MLRSKIMSWSERTFGTFLFSLFTQETPQAKAFLLEDTDLQQVLQRVRQRYAYVKNGGALLCMTLFTRLLFTLLRQQTVSFYVPLLMTMALDNGVRKCIWSFNRLSVIDHARFRARCLLLTTLHPAFQHAGGRYYSPHNRTWAVYTILQENCCRPRGRLPGAGVPHQEMLHYREWQHADDPGHRAVLQDLAKEQETGRAAPRDRKRKRAAGGSAAGGAGR